MSVLLEALKKAAEDKKKQNVILAESVAPSTDDKIDIADTLAEREVLPADEPLLEASSEDESVSLKFNFDVQKTEPEVVTISELPLRNDTHELSQTTNIEEQVKNSSEPHNEQANNLLDLIGTQDVLPATKTELSPEKEDKPQGDFRLKVSEVERGPVKDDLETKLMVSDTSDPVSPYSSTAYLNDSESVETSESKVEGTSFSHSEDIPSSNEPDTFLDFKENSGLKVSEQQTEALSESKVQDDWSLDQIPGYQNYGEQNPAGQDQAEEQAKAKAILPHFVKSAKKVPNKRRLYAISSILVVLAMAYYGMVYFDQQASAIDQDLQRYKVASHTGTQSPEVPKKLNNSSSTTQLASSENKPQTQLKEIPDALVKQHVEEVKEKRKVTAKANSVQLEKKAKSKRSVTKVEPKQAKMVIQSQPQVSQAELGFKAYQQGNWTLAEQYYQKAYDEDPKNIATLFGLGAVAVQKGEKNKALPYYEQVLKLEPGNILAQKAILSIKSSDGAGKETLETLRQMAMDHPSDPQVSFALGNVYAKKQNWVLAQSYYFKAYQQQPSQAIYALNLAVSLDQLGEYRLAKQYYEDALVKLPKSSTTLDIDGVKKRLVAIKQFLGKEK